MFFLFGFSIQEFFVCYFFGKKMAFVCEFQHTPLWKLMNSQGSTPHVDMKFLDMYLTHLRIRIQRGSFHIYLKKWFFWIPKDCCSIWTRAKNLLFFNFECYDLANGKEWDCKI